MCNLAVAIQRTPGNAEVRRLLAGQYGKMSSQGDGIATLVMDDAGRIAVDREVKRDGYAEVFGRATKATETSRLVAIHTRIASVGNVSPENVHFFKHGSRYFAHNGHVGEYMSFSRGHITGSKDMSSKRFDGKRASGAGMLNTLSSKALGKALKRASEHAVFVEKSTVEERILRLSENMDECKKCGYGNACPNHAGITSEVLTMEALLSSGRVNHVHLIPDDPNEDTSGLPGISADTPTSQMLLDTEGHKATGAIANLDPSDSLQFLQAMPKELTLLDLGTFAEGKKFSGVGLLVDEAVNRAWLMSTRQVDVHVGKDYLIAYSFLPQKDFPQWEYAMGIPLRGADDKRYPTATLDAGIYELNLSALGNGSDDIMEAYI